MHGGRPAQTGVELEAAGAAQDPDSRGEGFAKLTFKHLMLERWR